jgi:DNA-binding transcriptional LysR family regulator
MATPEQIRRRFKLRDLDTLTAVVQAGGIRKAAAQLHVSQPAVTKAVADMERLLGVRLLDRGPKGIEPTRYGAALLRRGTAIFDELRQGVDEIGSLADPNTGTLSVGSSESLMASIVPVILGQMHGQHPGVNFKMESGDPPVLVDRFLRERICEVVLLRPWAAPTAPELQCEPLFNEEIHLVAGAQSPWARRRRLKLEDLVEEPWVLSPVEVRQGSPVLEAFDAVGLSLPSRLILSGSFNLRASLLATGRYLTVVPSTILKFGATRGALKVLPIALPKWAMPTMLVTLSNRLHSPLAERFMHEARVLSRSLN